MGWSNRATPFVLFPYHLTPQVRGYVRDMYPTSVALKDELGEAYLSLLLHLHDEIKKCFIGFYVMGF